MVTVAVRRVNLDRSKESLLDFIFDLRRYFLLPNTAGCYTAGEAIRAARLGREVGLSDWVKIEVIGDQATLYPDVLATVEATKVLVKEGFTVLPYTSDDIVVAKRLIDAGAAAVMPLGAPIGSGLGIQNATSLRICARTDHTSSADCRRRRRYGLRRGTGDGVGRGCGLNELRDCRRRQSCADGRSDATRGPCWSPSVSRRGACPASCTRRRRRHWKAYPANDFEIRSEPTRCGSLELIAAPSGRGMASSIPIARASSTQSVMVRAQQRSWVAG